MKVCSNGDATYINSKLIAKANLNIAVVMQTLKNLHTQYNTNCMNATKVQTYKTNSK